MSINFGGNSGGGGALADDPVIVPLDIEAVGPAAPLVAGDLVYLTHTTVVTHLEPGGLRMLCATPGEGTAYIDLLADGVPMSPAPLQLRGQTRIVAPTSLKPACRTLMPGVRLEARLLSVPPGYAVWRGLRVVFLATARLPEPVLLHDSDGNRVLDDDDAPVAQSIEF